MSHLKVFVLVSLFLCSIVSGGWTCKSQVPLSKCEALRQGGSGDGSSVSSSVSPPSFLVPSGWLEIKRIFLVILENTDADVAMQQEFIKKLGSSGAVLSNSFAITHPSQPNYIALMSGDTQGVFDNRNTTVDVRHLGNLLVDRGMSWKVYAEDFPGNCFLGSTSGSYARRHVPFLSFKNVTSSAKECAKIVPATELDADIRNRTLPEFGLFIPNNDNNGHDTSAAVADKWLSLKFGNYIKDPHFMDGTLLIITYDESDGNALNQIHTVFYGAGVEPGTSADSCYDHYSLLATIEKMFKLGTLGKKDAGAVVIDSIWKRKTDAPSLTQD